MISDRFAADVRDEGGGTARLVLRGDVDIAADGELTAAASEAVMSGARSLVLDFEQVGYINSTGIALIVRLLAEARRDHREVIAEHLSPHYREIFRITRLSDYLTIKEPHGGEEAPA